MLASLPELYSELNEAWITAVNIDKTGSSGSYSYSLKSAPCGQTAEYCLGGDGWNITLPGYDASSSSVFYNTAGTSFVAPQISGALALLAEHFPNQTPEQLVDRLLASADNTWFTRDGTVTFGNGVQHGYSDDYGHGLMDIYAALQPITTSSLGRSIVTSNSNIVDLSSGSHDLGRSFLTSSRSFGDSIAQALDGEVNYFYDAMGSGFVYELDGHVLPQANTAPTINIESEIGKLQSAKSLNQFVNKKDKTYKNILKKKEISKNENSKTELALTLGHSAIPAQSFFNYDQYVFNGITDYNLPFLKQNDKGLSINSLFETDKLKLSLSSTTPVKENDETYMGDQKSILSSLEYEITDNFNIGLLNGIVNEREGFLGLDGNEAFSLDNSKNLSKFNSLKFQTNIKDDLSLTLTGSYASSDFTGDEKSLLKSANDIISNSYSISLNKSNLIRNDNFVISISQPNRVIDGELNLRLSEPVGKNGAIKLKEISVPLKPSGRQIDTTASYTYDVNDDLTLSTKLSHSSELNHIEDNKDIWSGFVGMKYKNLKIGVSDSQDLDKPSFKLDFKKEF